MTRETRWTISLAIVLAAAALLVGCDSDQSLAPEFRASGNTGSGSTPNPPSNAAASASAWNQVNVTWRDNSSNESGFEIHRSTTGPSGAFTLLASTVANATSYSNGGLAASTQYCYEVRTFRTVGGKTSYSAFSNTVCATTPVSPLPAAPLAVHGAPDAWRILVTWTDTASNESGFRVERSAAIGGPWSAIGALSANVTSFYDYYPPAADHPACYRVYATNSYGDSPASNVACTAIPAVPTGLTAIGVSGPKIDLTWIDNSAVEDGYEVQRTSLSEPWHPIAELPPNSSSYHDTAVVLDETYFYSVRAKKDGGYSYSSTDASAAAASAPPAAPSSTNVTPTSSTSIQIDWVDNSSNRGGFRVERSENGGASWAPVGTTDASGGPVADSGRVAEVAVCYRVFAFNSQGDSPPSNIACTTPPAAPTAFTMTYIGETTVDFTWTDNSAVEDGYEIWVFGQCAFYPVASLPPNTTSYEYSAPDASWYTYDVVATKDGGYSDFYFPPPSGGC